MVSKALICCLFNVVGGYDLMGDGQAQPEVAFGAPGFFRPVEAIENMAFILGGYADTGICHCDLETGPASHECCLSASDEERAGFSHTIRKEGRRMNNLINDMLTLARSGIVLDMNEGAVVRISGRRRGKFIFSMPDTGI